MTDQKLLAQHLYLNEHKTQKEIATEIGVSERTIYTWIHQYAWDQLKRAAYQAPVTISENLCSELVELQNSIARREPGMRYPTPQEAEVIRKLIGSIEKMKKYPSLSQNMQILETFKNYIRPIDKDFTRQLSNYTQRFLSGKSVNGFAPYQMEYGVGQVAPVMSVYDEPGESETCACPDPQACPYSATCSDPCSDVNNCKHPGSCTAPDCTRSKSYINEISSDPLQRNSVKPVTAITEEERRVQYEIFMEENGFTFSRSSAANSTGELPGHIQQPEETGSIPAAQVEDTIEKTMDSHQGTYQQLSANSRPEISAVKCDKPLTGKGNGPLPASRKTGRDRKQTRKMRRSMMTK